MVASVVMVIMVGLRWDAGAPVLTALLGLTGFLGGLVALRAGVRARWILDVAVPWHIVGLTLEACVFGGERPSAFAPLALVPLAAVWWRGYAAGALALLWGLVVFALAGIGVMGPPATSGASAEIMGLAASAIVCFTLAAAYESERRRREAELESQTRRAQLALSAGRLGLLEWPEGGGSIFADARARALAGFTADEPVSLARVFAQLADRDRATAAGLARAARNNGGRASAEFEWLHEEGTAAWFACDLVVEDREAGRFVVALIRDVTAARRLLAEREEFLADVSHEIRSPLTALHGALSLLEFGANRTAEDRRYLSLASKNAERVLTLVDDLLELQRGEAMSLAVELRPVLTGVVLAELVRAMPPLSPPVNVSVQVGLPAVVTDAARLAQIVGNLLSNAVKVTPDGAAIILRALVREGGGVRIEVEDHGPGIPEEFRPRIFQRFSQARPGQKTSGLGLAISRALIERLGGTIGFVTELGKGTTFWVELPAGAAD